MSLINTGSPNIQSAVTGSGVYYNYDTLQIIFPRTFVAGDSIGWTVDGTLITTTFATTSNAMLDAILADFVAITGSVKAGIVVSYDKPQIKIEGNQIGHTIAFTLPTGTADLQASTVINHSGIEEYGLLITNPLDVLLATVVDTAGGGVVYTGYARAGSLEASQVWAIKRVTTAGAIVTTVWAGGVVSAAYSWTNRATLTYA